MTVGELRALLDTHHDSTTVVFKDPHCYFQILGVSNYYMNEEDRDKIAMQTGHHINHADVTIIWGD